MAEPSVALPEGFELDPEPDEAQLPKGFELDPDGSPGLPEGFTLDPPKPAEKTTGLLFSEQGGEIGPGALPQAFIDGWEDIKKFMATGDEQAAFRTAANLATGGAARGLVKGAEAGLGAVGGKPPFQVIEGGLAKSEKAMDDLMQGLASALKDPEAISPERMKELTKFADQIRQKAKDFEKATKDTDPELDKEFRKGNVYDVAKGKPEEAPFRRTVDKMDKDAQAQLDSYFDNLKQFLNAEVDAELRGEFKLVEGGKSLATQLKSDLKAAADEFARSKQKGKDSPDLTRMLGVYAQRLRSADAWHDSLIEVVKANREAGIKTPEKIIQSLKRGMEFHVDEASKAQAAIDDLRLR